MTARVRSPLAALMAGVAVLLFVAVLSTVGDSAAEIGPGWVPGVNEVAQEPDEEGGGADLSVDVETPPALRAVLAVLLVLLLLVLGAMFLLGLLAVIIGFHTSKARRVAQGQAGAAELPEDADDAKITLMAKAVRTARDRLRLRDGGEPGDAVVRAWLLLERAAADAGLTRKPHQTPTEFTTAVFTDLRVDAGALDRLRTLYQQARFSSRPVGEDDVDLAQEALDRLVADFSDLCDRRRAAAAAESAASVDSTAVSTS